MEFPEPFRSALLAQQIIQSLGLRFCFIGGLVVSRWGRVRATQDADISVFTGFVNEESIIDMLLSKFKTRRDGAKDFALQYRVLLLKSDTNVGIDISLGGLPFEERVVQRGSFFEFFPGLSLFTCSAEDLIVYKAFAGRGTDWDDCRSIIVKQGSKLDRNLILRELSILAELKEEPEMIDKLERIFNEQEQI